MKKTKWILLGAGVAVLLVAVALVLSFCGILSDGSEGGKDPTVGPATDYSVQVVNEEGTPLEGIGVYIYQDQLQEELVWFDKTDAAGNMTFTAEARDTYVAVLSGIPTGYEAEEFYALTGASTQIVLKVGVMTEEDMQNIRYKLGDKMLDFTVTDTDGKTYTLYELLKTKKAVVLNFWYTSCEPCKLEFPYLAEAYKNYADKLELLAMNPVDTDAAAVAQFKTDNGLPFPVVAVDPNWANIMQISGYPTTVIIDRYGNISLIHKGSIESANTFEQIFEYFTAEDYEPSAIKSIDEIVEEQPEGTKDNPYENGSFTSFDVTVKAGATFYIRLYKQVEAYYLSVEGKNCDADFTLELQGKKYEDDDGERTVYVTPVGAFVALEVQITNNSKQEQTYTFRRSAPKGSYGNPYKMKLGEFDVRVPAGSNEGIYYTYVAEEEGALKITCLESSVGTKFGMVLYNLNSYAMRTLESDGKTDDDGNLTLSIDAKKGQKIQFVISTEPNDSNQYPAGNFKLKAEFGEGENEITREDLPRTTYTITVVDQENQPVPQVSVGFTGEFVYVVEPEEDEAESQTTNEGEATPSEEGTTPPEEETTPPEEEVDPDQIRFDIKVDETLTTDEKGIATTEQISGPYTATIRVPEGYRLETVQYELTAESPDLTVNMHRIIMADYTVVLTYPDGKPVPGVSMMLGSDLKTTDANGTATFHKEVGQYSVTFIGGSIPVGYELPGGKTTVEFPQDQTTLALTLAAVGVIDNPYKIEKFPYTTRSLGVGETVFANILAQVHYDAEPVLTVRDADAVVTYGGVTYQANAQGVVEVPMNASAGTLMAIGNAGSTAKAMTLEVCYPLGSQYNPVPITDLDSVSVKLEAGDTDGYYLQYTPENAGALALRVAGVEPADGLYTATLTTQTNGTVALSESSVAAYVLSMENALICVKAQDAQQALELTLSGTFTIDPNAIDQGKGIYKLAVADYDGTPISGAIVIFITEGSDEPVHQGITNAEGKLDEVLLDKAVYKLNIAVPGKDYKYDTTAATFASGVTQLTVLMTQNEMTESFDREDYNKTEGMYLKEGAAYITGLQPVYGEAMMKYFIFKPEKVGTYWVGTSSAGVIPSYWGYLAAPHEMKTQYDAETNRVKIDVQPTEGGGVPDMEILLGFYGTPANAVVIISHEDQYEWSIEQEPYNTDWLTDYQITQFTLPSGVSYGDLTYVDITDATKNYTAVLNPDDGRYHLNAVDGPVLYINMGYNAPYLSVYERMHGDGAYGGRGLSKVFLKDPSLPLSQENFLKKEAYTSRMDEYIAASDQTAGDTHDDIIYPLTVDLVYAIQNGCEDLWTDTNNLLYTTFATAVPGRQWMFAVCYYDDGTVDLSYPQAAMTDEPEALPPEEEELVPPVEENTQETLPEPEQTQPTEPEEAEPAAPGEEETLPLEQ